MFSRSDGSSFGRRLRRAALVFAVPLVLAALAVGHYRTCSAACRNSRPSLADADAQKIVDNAVKYTDGGSVSVAVESAGRYARLIVSDTGRGIPRAEQKSVFRRFYRASNAGDRVGSGLGLATVREIVESRYGGKVSLNSTPGMGSTFTVTFPRRL